MKLYGLQELLGDQIDLGKLEKILEVEMAKACSTRTWKRRMHFAGVESKRQKWKYRADIALAQERPIAM